jgi:hypothetical protein
MDQLTDLPGKDIREKMINFIRKHYADTLGNDIDLLDPRASARAFLMPEVSPSLSRPTRSCEGRIGCRPRSSSA